MTAPRVLTRLAVTLATLCALGLPTAGRAATILVPPAPPGALAIALAKAAPGDRLQLAAGRYVGNINIRKPVTLEGVEGTVLDGGGQNSVIAVFAPNVTLRNLTLENSGASAIDFNGGIYVDKGGEHFTAENNRIIGTLFGIVVRSVDHATLRGNLIRGRSDMYETSLGDGIHLRNTNDDLIADNDIEGGRDGIFAHVAHRNSITGNRMKHVRFAVHYMYCNQNKVIGNLSAHNTVGYALMYSNEVEVRDNVSIDDRDHGLMLHTAYHSVMTGNLVRGAKETGLFIYTSAHNLVSGNRVENSGIGIHVTGGSEDNQFFGNAMINNQTQAKFSGTVTYEWSKDGRGNYWSDNTAFDLNGDGLADTAYRPNSVMDRLVWRYPLSKMLMASPIMEALRFAQSQFPALMPGGIVDSHPLMAPPPLSPGLPSDHEVGS